MLRGAQTPGELKHRTERLHPFASLSEVEGVLEGLIERELVAPARAPTRARRRFATELVVEGDERGAPAAGERPAPRRTMSATLEARIATLEEAVEALRLRLGDAGLESGGESVPDRFQLHAVEDVLEEPTDD